MMPDRRRLKAMEAWEEERQMHELNAVVERMNKREQIARQLARGYHHGNDDIDIGYYDLDGKDVRVDSVDGGFWVHARIWVDADEVEERMEA